MSQSVFGFQSESYGRLAHGITGIARLVEGFGSGKPSGAKDPQSKDFQAIPYGCDVDGLCLLHPGDLFLPGVGD
jgi:hypothetical protein